jgi:hypothetical protein
VNRVLAAGSLVGDEAAGGAGAQNSAQRQGRHTDEGFGADRTLCRTGINLDASADAYVSDIFGHQYTVIDNIARLPEQLPKLFMALTR